MKLKIKLIPIGPGLRESNKNVSRKNQFIILLNGI